MNICCDSVLPFRWLSSVCCCSLRVVAGFAVCNTCLFCGGPIPRVYVCPQHQGLPVLFLHSVLLCHALIHDVSQMP